MANYPRMHSKYICWDRLKNAEGLLRKKTLCFQWIKTFILIYDSGNKNNCGKIQTFFRTTIDGIPFGGYNDSEILLIFNREIIHFFEYQGGR